MNKDGARERESEQQKMRVKARRARKREIERAREGEKDACPLMTTDRSSSRASWMILLSTGISTAVRSEF